MVIARGKKEDSLYIMQGKICKWEINVAQDTTKELWHNHLNPAKIVLQVNNT